jgi:hypothetical protein
MENDFPPSAPSPKDANAIPTPLNLKDEQEERGEKHSKKIWCILYIYTKITPTEHKIFPIPQQKSSKEFIKPAMEPPAGDAALPPPPPSSSVIFLGTGCSGALPDTRCLLRPSAPPCAVCSLGVSLPPEQNPNYRCACSQYPVAFKIYIDQPDSEHLLVLL